jgi:tripartite-type tricarboxylate transporter receptor subunit TctC
MNPLAARKIRWRNEHLENLRSIAIAAAITAVCPTLSIAADAFPSRPVRLIVPYAAGGGADIVARSIAQKLGESWGQQVVVDNRAGASGNIGTEIAAKTAGDGYTLLLIGPNHTVNSSLYAKLPFDPIRDFAPVSLVTSAPYLLVVNSALAVNSVKDLIALAKSKQGKIFYGSAGNGTAGHLGMELIKTMGGLEMVHVPYKGSPPMLTDLLAGQISVVFDNVLSSAPHVKGGRLRAIAVSTRHRSSAMPDVPTVAESGLPGFEVAVWQGILAPAGTPVPVVEKIHADIVAVLKRPEMKERMASQGADIIGSTPQEFASFMKADLMKWAKVVKDSGARVD